jgi:hypothetical protein
MLPQSMCLSMTWEARRCNRPRGTWGSCSCDDSLHKCHECVAMCLSRYQKTCVRRSTCRQRIWPWSQRAVCHPSTSISRIRKCTKADEAWQVSPFLSVTLTWIGNPHSSKKLKHFSLPRLHAIKMTPHQATRKYMPRLAAKTVTCCGRVEERRCACCSVGDMMEMQILKAPASRCSVTSNLWPPAGSYRRRAWSLLLVVAIPQRR